MKIIGEFTQELTEHQKKKCRNFLKKFINVKNFPLSELENITAAETSKVLENSYRAMNIAFIDELGLEIGCNVEVIRSGEIIPKVVRRV